MDKTITYIINSQQITIKPTPFEGKKSVEQYCSQLSRALSKIDVLEKNYTIHNPQREEASISWTINE